MKRYLSKHTATLLFSIILLAQAAIASAGGTATASLTQSQSPTREFDSGRVVKQSTDEPYPTEMGTEDVTPTAEITVEPTLTELPTEEATPTIASTAEVTPTELPTQEITPTAVVTVEVTPTSLPTEDPSPTYAETLTVVPTETPYYTSTVVPSETSTPMSTDMWTSTFTASPTATETATALPPTLEPTATPSLAPTLEPTATATNTNTPVFPTATYTATVVPPTLQPTATPTSSPTSTPLPPTATYTWTPVPPTATPTLTYTPSPIPPTATSTATATATPFAPDCSYSIAPGDVYGSRGLIWAITQANANANPDIICLASGSTYSVIQLYENNTGLPVIRTPITIRGYNAALTRPTTRGVIDFRLLYVQSGADFRLDAVSIVGGQAVQGGGIYSAGTLTITNAIIDGNNALASSGQSSGGGIYIADGIVNIADTIIRNNRANTGAGIYALGSNTRMITINRVIFSGNQASVTGGGLFNFNASVAIFSSQFVSNTAPQGAGIRNQVFGILSMSNSLVRDNVATTSGGGIALDNANAIANNNCIVANVAPSGSAIYSSVTSGTKANFEFNYWGNGQPQTGAIVGAVDYDPALLTAPQFCRTLYAR